MGVEALKGVSGAVAPIGERQPPDRRFDSEFDEEPRDDDGKDENEDEVRRSPAPAPLLRRQARRGRPEPGTDDGKGLKVNLLA